MTQTTLHELEQRPQKYWNVDGIPELVIGGFWLISGGTWLLGEALPRGQAFNVYWLLLGPVLVISGFAVRRAIVKLKERVTFPRTGYVEYPKPGPWIVFLMVVLALGSVVLMGWLIASGRAVPPSAVGVFACLIILINAFHQRALHLLALAITALILGFAMPSLTWLFVGLGAAASALGGWRLCRYLKANPR